ncbi:Plant self-incompatibility S1 [Macleaya cordata]|uniref:S-protein homolog n=1 Tax=Macleaya cordata TaxID=56857 RepID=A0A200PZI5_MACCD|nr:Plant self-incompatibility S1 [Macleaya cordata]
MFLLIEETSAGLFKRDRKTIRFENGLDRGTDIWVHCKSGDRDIGEHKLKNGEVVEWSFKPSFWGVTLYYCYVAWWGEDGKWTAAFDIYGGDAPDIYKRSCLYWSARREGICFSNSNTCQNEILWFPYYNYVKG